MAFHHRFTDKARDAELNEEGRKGEGGQHGISNG
jgi:hypothetical protein